MKDLFCDETMSLEGGISQYIIHGKQDRIGSEKPPFGRMVKFLDCNGHDYQLEEARKHFKEGQVLSVKEIYVGGCSSEVEFIGYEGKMFNTVMFADVEDVA